MRKLTNKNSSINTLMNNIIFQKLNLPSYKAETGGEGWDLNVIKYVGKLLLC